MLRNCKYEKYYFNVPDWACGVSNAHLFFSEGSEEVSRAPVAVGFTVADALKFELKNLSEL